MAIQTNYNFNGIEIPNAIIRIDRLWGSSKEGWTALVGIYIAKDVPAVDEVTEQKLVTEESIDENGGTVAAVYETVITQNAIEAYTDYALITDFNHSASYVSDERGYMTLYKSLTEKFGGIEI